MQLIFKTTGLHQIIYLTLANFSILYNYFLKQPTSNDLFYTTFSILHNHFFKTSYIKLSILCYILLKYYLCVWRDEVEKEERVRGRESISKVREKIIKYKIQKNDNYVNIHDYCSNNDYLYNFKLIDVGNF